jgi:GH43 family beta-xylosidase
MRAAMLFTVVVLAGCGDDAGPSSSSNDADAAAADASTFDAAVDASSPDASTDAPATDARACTTRITYGTAWIRPQGHPDFDVVSGDVTWDGTCGFDGTNSFATLSNGFKPYFAGRTSCRIALDRSCDSSACATRVGYGASWIAAQNHPQKYDDVAGRVLWDGQCNADGANSYAPLSNGWQPHFTGGGACDVSLSYTQCGGLYANPVIPTDCPDPGVLRDGTRYVLVCTSGNAADAFPIRVSNDLVAWTSMGHVFPSASKPTWALSDFWAPEIHRVGTKYVAYFSARAADGKLSIGAASSPSATGPFTDIGAPLVHDPNMGLIDASEYEAPDGTKYLLWKEDGNAVGRPTPIHAQKLANDGLSVTGAVSTLITNDQQWEGAVVEGPWMVDHGGSYYLFYSGASYANASYAVGVARAASPLGPFTKAGAPIVATRNPWVGPGHCSVIDTPGGDTVMIYHAWQSGHVNGPGDGRLTLVDSVTWLNGWPSLIQAPSALSMPMP